MMGASCRTGIAIVCVSFFLGACGGGGSDDLAASRPATTASTGLSPLTFLLFPNPQVQPDGSLQVDSPAYATAYYAAIDPANAKDTFAKWKAANGYDSGTGTQVGTVFGDTRDLGYGRRMTVRQNVDGTVAAYVENYQVSAVSQYGFTTLNLDAAVVEDTRWRIGINAIEHSPGPAGGASFTKFFNFNTSTGARELKADLDGLGQKAMPTICITCHGGRGDALTPAGGAPGFGPFSLVRNSASLARGDVQAHMQPLETDTFDFSASSGFRRVDQEAAIKAINKMVLCTYPRVGAVTGPEDNCRRAAIGNEWQGTAAATLIKGAYGGNGMPNAIFVEPAVPAGWAAQPALYQNVVAPSCRACHILRGTGNQSDIDFTTSIKFSSYASDIKYHAYDRGNMPLSKIVYDAFYSTSRADTLATFLQTLGVNARDTGGAVLRPGRPVAIPGPDRVIPQGAVSLSGAGSLYASSYAWSIVSGPNGAIPPTNVTLSNANSVQPTFNATVNGTYVVQLVASEGVTQSTPVQAQLVVNSALAPVPTTIRFSNIKTALQGIGCTGCHVAGGGPPIFFNNIDRDGNGTAGDATDDQWFYAEVRGLVNFTALDHSALLRKPSGQHHGGLLQPGFNTALAPGNAGRANYDLFLNWILNGAPQ